MTQMTVEINGKPVLVNVLPIDFESERQARFTALFNALDKR